MIVDFLKRTKGKRGPELVDFIAYGFLFLGILIILLPVLWLGLSSIKEKSALDRFDPRMMPYAEVLTEVNGRNKQVYLHRTENDNLIQEVIKVEPTEEGMLVRNLETGNEFEALLPELILKEQIAPAWANYIEPISGDIGSFSFLRLFYNSTFVTVISTLICLVVNSMAAFALSKYRFRGRDFFMLFIIASLLIPPTIILIPLFLVVWNVGLYGNLWGVIIPVAATPSGIFLLRQYMLSIPDEYLEAARMDAASEWKIYWRIIIPLTLPALAVLAILSVIWRWNDFLWPLIVLLPDSTQHTIQIGLTQFKGEFDTSIHYLLAMTVVSLIPVTLVFAFLQKFITTGIANQGIK